MNDTDLMMAQNLTAQNWLKDLDELSEARMNFVAQILLLHCRDAAC